MLYFLCTQPTYTFALACLKLITCSVQSGPCVRYPFTTSDLCTCRIRDRKGEDLIPRSVITRILCAVGVRLDKRTSTPAGWMDIKFCKTNLFIEHKELDGRFQFKFTHPLAGPSKLLLPNPELTTVLGGTNIDFSPHYTH
ncbi:unnamed protein product [Microthlaspi erraticum]|uniref:Arabidopsis retrotransposon Orf1 C-terminal domain-containing protein n=1 Tax=Microthlaspi erraticum TaxID=1685480 RepID=A0A6D2KIV4_9BRAS|nr:unnamed protein product [Microthlaspi erraticum]